MAGRLIDWLDNPPVEVAISIVMLFAAYLESAGVVEVESTA